MAKPVKDFVPVDETFHEPQSICPWCGHKHDSTYEWFPGSKEDVDVECEACDKPIHIYRYIEVSYTTKRRDA